jgi:hypothetical protein
MSVTGRDEYIVNKALAYAILTIDRLPQVFQERSDQADMKRLLARRVPNAQERKFLLACAAGHIDRTGLNAEAVKAIFGAKAA